MATWLSRATSSSRWSSKLLPTDSCRFHRWRRVRSAASWWSSTHAAPRCAIGARASRDSNRTTARGPILIDTLVTFTSRAPVNIRVLSPFMLQSYYYKDFTSEVQGESNTLLRSTPVNTAPKRFTHLPVGGGRGSPSPRRAACVGNAGLRGRASRSFASRNRSSDRTASSVRAVWVIGCAPRAGDSRGHPGGAGWDLSTRLALGGTSANTSESRNYTIAHRTQRSPTRRCSVKSTLPSPANVGAASRTKDWFEGLGEPNRDG